MKWATGRGLTTSLTATLQLSHQNSNNLPRPLQSSKRNPSSFIRGTSTESDGPVHCTAVYHCVSNSQYTIGRQVSHLQMAPAMAMPRTHVLAASKRVVPSSQRDTQIVGFNLKGVTSSGQAFPGRQKRHPRMGHPSHSSDYAKTKQSCIMLLSRHSNDKPT